MPGLLGSTGLLSAGLIFGGLLLVVELGFHFGRRSPRWSREDLSQLASIQGAILGLLALLLGFSFAAAAARFANRGELIVEQANAASAILDRMPLLPEPQRSSTLSVLRQHIDAWVELFDSADSGLKSGAMQKAAQSAAAVANLLYASIERFPTLANVLVPASDQLTGLHGRRTAERGQHLPIAQLLVLFACSAVAVGTVGYSSGLAGRRTVWLSSALAFLIAAVLWLIIDLDQPRHGVMKVSQQPLLDLQMRLRPVPVTGK